MSEMKDRVECARHGSREATYVCQHLVSGQGSGFHYAHDDEDPDERAPGDRNFLFLAITDIRWIQ